MIDLMNSGWLAAVLDACTWRKSFLVFDIHGDMDNPN